MAAGVLSSPGTEFGPCADPCQHKDCAATRLTSVSFCVICGEQIGYETRYYMADGGTPKDGPWEHAACAEQAIDETETDDAQAQLPPCPTCR
jgi:hypothetical protein